MNTGMTVSGMTKDVTSTKEAIPVATIMMIHMITCLMITLMMVKQVQTSKIGSTVMKDPHIRIGMDVVNLKIREMPTTTAIGMAKTVRMISGSIATGKNKTAHGCKAKIKTTSEDIKRAKLVAMKKLSVNSQDNQEMLTLMSSIFRCSSTALRTGFRSRTCALEDSSATAMSE